MAWNITGNSGIDPSSNFLGTTDNQPLVIKTNGKEALRINPAGSIGVGTNSPQNRLHVGSGSSSIVPSRVNAVVASNNPDAGIAIAQNSGVNVLLQASGAGGYLGTTSNHPLVFRTNDLDRVVVDINGNLHVGPGSSSIAPSRVNAAVASNKPDAGIAIAQNSGVNVLLQASGAGGYLGTTSNHPLVLRTNDLDRLVVDTNGNVRINGDIMLANADCAEDFDIADTALAEPGTVMVLDEEGKLHHSQKAYDKRVAGVISGAGNYRPAIVLDKQKSLCNRKAIALIGKVYCKVDANHSPIQVGDLLTTSTIPGHAMKAADPLEAFGAVIGKALSGLQEGQGLIPVLIALQ
jgi:hypothetical protein